MSQQTPTGHVSAAAAAATPSLTAQGNPNPCQWALLQASWLEPQIAAAWTTQRPSTRDTGRVKTGGGMMHF